MVQNFIVRVYKMVCWFLVHILGPQLVSYVSLFATGLSGIALIVYSFQFTSDKGFLYFVTGFILALFGTILSQSLILRMVEDGK